MFAGADTALTSLSASRLAALIEEAKGARRKTYERIQRDDAKIRSRYLLGRVACTCLSALFFYQVLEPIFPTLGVYLSFGITVVLSSTVFEASTMMR